MRTIIVVPKIILQRGNVSIERLNTLATSPAVTIDTAAWMANIVDKVRIVKAIIAHLPILYYPVIRLSRVAMAYLGANSKKGYFNTLARINIHSKSKP
jgi:hypothetical protein